MHRLLCAFTTLIGLLALASPAVGARIGLDDRNGFGPDSHFASGNQFDDFRLLITGLGHTIVPVTSFDTAGLAAANISALVLQQPYFQSGGGYSGAEISAIQSFVSSGFGLALHGETGFDSDSGLASMNQLASVFGVSFSATESETDGRFITNLDNTHPVTAGVGVGSGGQGMCVDAQRQLSIGAPAVDLTPTSPLPNVPEDDALAAVTAFGGSGGNVVLLSDTTLFKDGDVASFDANLDCLDNRTLATNVIDFIVPDPVPEPATGVLLGLGMLGLGLRRRRALRAAPLAAVAVGAFVGLTTANPASAVCTGSVAQCASGEIGAPFSEGTIAGAPTTKKCVTDPEGDLVCKPAAGTLVLLEDDRFLYWNALEGTENIEMSIATDFGVVSVNDQSRVLSLAAGDAPSWSFPNPNDGGANPNGPNPDGLGPADGGANGGADGALFCSDQIVLHDGRVLAVGGTDYYNDIGPATVSEGTVVPIVFPEGSVELEGLKNARIFHPSTNTWTQTSDMEFGRWYPTVVTLADGDVFVASGVTKLLKPVYPETPTQSGRNVVVTETYDTACGTWSNNGSLAEKSLPLFPRLHLLPNGHVYYNAAGQAFNPFGQGYDQSLWNLVSTYDPGSKSWTDIALAGFPLALSSAGLEGIATQLNPSNPDFPGGLLTGLANEVLEDPAALAEVLDDEILEILGTFLGLDLTDPAVVQSIMGGGFRGSTFSVMLPLVPDANGDYPVAEFLTSGGVESSIVNPSPGNYVATTNSRIDTLDVSGAATSYASRLTGALTQPRWYGSGVLLPNGQVLALSGADRDEVQTPGAGISVTVMELFDPDSETWSPVADQGNERTYHNTAVLMRDGRVLVGGHAPITTAYGAHTQLPGFSPQDGRDPSFQIYSPPYVFRDDRPVIANVSDSSLVHGQNVTVTLSSATPVDELVLMRRTATTHLVDGDQRAVVLPVVSTNALAGTVTLSVPNANVLPAGKYMLFANTTVLGDAVPSTGVAISIEGNVGSCP